MTGPVAEDRDRSSEQQYHVMMSKRFRQHEHQSSSSTNPGNQPVRRWSVRSRILLLVALLTTGLAAIGLFSEIALWRSYACLEQRQHEASLAWLNSIRWCRSGSAELHFLLARTHRRLNHEPEFRTELERARELGWPPSELQFEQDLAKLQAGQYQGLHAPPDILLARAGSDLPEVAKGLATYYLGNFRFAELRQILDDWRRNYPEDAGVYFLQGRAFLLLSRWSDAEEQFRLALQHDPTYPEAHSCAAEALVALNRFEEALSVIRRAPAAEQQQPKALDLAADCQIALGKLEAAEATFQQLLTLQPDNADVWLKAGNLSAERGHDAQALESLRRAYALRPEDVGIRQELARLLVVNGLEQEAQAHFDLLEQTKPSWIDLDELRMQLMQEPENLELRYQVARKTWNWKSHEAGAAWFRSLLARNPRHRLAHAALADHYELAGQPQFARQHRELAGDAVSELRIPERAE